MTLVHSLRKCQLTSCCVGITMIIISSGCRDHAVKSERVKDKSRSFAESVTEFVNTKNVTEANARWVELQGSVDPSNVVQINEWLSLQQMILTNTTMPNAVRLCDHLAVQEFRLWCEHGRPYKEWLLEVKNKQIFDVDPFIAQNIDMALKAIDNAEEKGQLR